APLALQGVKRLINYHTHKGMLDFFAQEVVELDKVLDSEDAPYALGLWMNNPDPEAYKPVFKGR
ncbi:MAG: hypothetical protein ACK5HY_15450, partial [Parahaliea sp.]